MLARRQTFFEDMRALICYMVFESWPHLMDFMIKGLQLETSSNPARQAWAYARYVLRSKMRIAGKRGGLSAGSHTPLSFPVCLQARPRRRVPPTHAVDPPGTAKCPEPLCMSEVLPRLIVISEDHVSRCYPAFITHTDSCVSPPPSSCLGRTLNTRSMQVAVSPCWEKDLVG